MKLKIVSFNLRYDKPDRGNNALSVRRDAVAAHVQQAEPDLIGTQEGQAHQLLDLHRLLPAYQSIGGDRLSNGRGEHCAIFYHRLRLQYLEGGDFWLSQTPEIPGSITAEWGNHLPRMVTWAIFMTATGQKITAFNTHLDYESARARELGAQLIHSRLGSLEAGNSRIFLTGDFNCAPDRIPRQTFRQPLSNGVHLLDALAGVEWEGQQTYHDFTGKGFAAVDTIYYDSRTPLLAAQVETGQWQGILPSDHFPVMAEFSLDKK